MHLKTNDIVQIIAGNAKGERGKVLHIDHEAGKVTIEGVNKVFKHVRKSQKNPQGGRLNKEMPIQISNVLLVCSRCNQPTRTGSRPAANGAKERFCRRKTCHAALGQIAPSKTRSK
ncbi:MAG: 50S ribosomal protein L24 [Pirellulaceae bacterium]